MTRWIAFILGLTIGIAIYFWKENQKNSKIKKLLSSFSPNFDRVDSLPITSLVRREFTYVYEQRQQLEKELAILQDLLFFAPIAYLQVDEENQLLWCNEQAKQLLKIDRWQPGKQRLLLELVRSYEIDQLIEETRRTQEKQIKEWVFYITETQKTRSLALKGFSYPLPAKQVGIFLENRQPLVELIRARDQTFSDLAHELKTPLTAIALVAEALQNRLQNPELGWVTKMLQQTQRLSNLVKDWLEISKLNENPTQHLHYQSLELQELILASWETLQPIAQQKEITLTYSGVAPISLEADRDRLTQVFLNLFDNSIKHSLPQEVINIEVQVNIKEIIINIIDSGKGFSEPDLPHVFERLYRGDPSRTRLAANFSQHGSGLGLAIVKQIINAHNGSITAKNHPATGGAWLQIILPHKEQN
ncbi:MAG: GHKL domain-containing protein [Gomphosphaeria aponina SAG 52.96 = DSM 107014]|uniref:histidine kinase n=1 Tax=Gomphosphaeria aponina SAG 52.96 = DSM 107014 TaxID=1521640 RepID=A0A941GRY9_9CHRO|nr:GHKL domain-containing protein [Gomphosphaeria aponina SAG 52.96 = DSM 107014]